MKVSFYPDKRIKAEVNGKAVITDQTLQSGGLGENPNPFEIFKASLGCCMGYYVMSFCIKKDIPVDWIWLDIEFDEVEVINNVNVKIKVDKRFPEKYLKAVIKATDACKVKKQLKAPPSFVIDVERATQSF